ncbi:MAG: SRPBCC domain-containing protein [Myxococcales bacterium]|nr:SRPBCC domain-containing protein [Myxococcales bacterium]MDD9968348.1 SRPBCC domain-containing protein [Myxococcales bacterium]
MTQTQTHESHRSQDRELIVEREFEAPIQAVFDAFVDPEQLPKWWGPEDMTVPVCEMDVREGGAWKTIMRAPNGNEHVVKGVYKTIEAPTRLAFTWAWQYEQGPGHETLVTVTLSDLGGRTRVRLEQRTFAEKEHRDNHVHGWESTLEALKKYLART